MRRADPRPALFALALALAGCGANPPAPQPAARQTAEQAEALAVDDWQHAEFARAARGFAEAARRYTAIDDAPAARRVTLHQARAELAQGHADAALATIAVLPPADLATAMLATQAQLARGDIVAATTALAAADAACAEKCADAASLAVLRARLALSRGDASAALAATDTALASFKDIPADAPPAAEAGNAWRLRAEALLARDDAAAAADAARRALDIDRRLALAEKIARDWLLIARAEAKVSPGGTATAAAYRRAREIAEAAGIADVAETAAAALASSTQR